MRLPDFYIIGAMKCATSMVQQQLAQDDRVFMSDPKEPNFFSDDGIFANGMGWYSALFSKAGEAQLCGEASTHYTKWPTLPLAPERLKEATPEAKFVYIIRHPIDRLVSHYLHSWTMREITVPFSEAIPQHPELWQYSLYHAQLERWFAHFPRARFLIMTQEGIKNAPHENYARLTDFLGLEGAVWVDDLPPQNVTAERVKRFPFYDFVMDNPGMQAVRRALVPHGLRQKMAQRLRPPERPAVSDEEYAYLNEKIGPDIAALGALVGLDLSLENYAEKAAREVFDIR
ncbi:MAG: sulfotransferase [Pseudomonadota bacterium]